MRFRGVSFGAFTGVFILTGLVGAFFGPLLVPFAHHFHISDARAGQALSAFFIGGLIGVTPGWQGLRRTSGRVVVSCALATLSLGLIVAASSTSWTVFMVGVTLFGVAFGTLDLSLNSLLSRTNPEVRTSQLSLGNAGYGLGSVLGPVLVIIVRPAHFAALFLGSAVISLILASLLRGLHAPAQAVEPLQIAIRREPRRRIILLTFATGFGFYVSLETSASGWMSTQLQGWHYSPSLGSWVTASFWIMMTVGRASGTWLHRRFGPTHLVLGCLVGAIVVTLAALNRDASLVAFPLLGALLATIFPMAILWYTDLCPHDSDGLGALMIATMLGGSAGPGLVSFMVGHYGVFVVPLMLCGYATCCLVVFSLARRFTSIELSTV